MKRVFVTGIGTDVGKTLVSAILCEAWEADYWKPVQSGTLEHTDRMEVASLLSNSRIRFYPETYILPYPLSPHSSADLAGIRIEPEKFVLPQTAGNLVVEGAGGLMVPLNNDFLMLDLIEQLGLPVILVSKNYLGSINHSLLSIEVLRKRNIPLAGIVFNGESNPSTESVIANYAAGTAVLGRIPLTEKVDKAFVQEQARAFRETI